MAIFELKSDLPLKTQEKIDYLEAIDSAKRTTAQAAFLTALTPYLTNAVLSVDASGNIVAASGLTVPTGYSGFAKNATFVKTDASTNGLYTNTGSTTVAAWDLVDQASTSNITDKAVTSEKLADTIDFDGKVLQLDELTPKNAVAATGTIISDETLPASGTELAIGTRTYTLVTDLTTEPVAVADEILLGANYGEMLVNIKSALLGTEADEGTKWSTGTLPNEQVIPGTIDGVNLPLTAAVKGLSGDSIALSSDDAHISFGEEVDSLAGGTNGTVGSKFQIVVDDTNVYLATAANTIADANWKKLVLQSL